ncbi:MAG: 2-amino-4-ketopentanoate thiolase [Nitrospirota bacterium]|nr:MAG: 2-amino-4-ketopentanoate thiolase [Nitrospirota bacterium]
MADQIAKGTWVQIHHIVLSRGERAPQVPRDTRQVPLEMTVKGFLVEPACLGEEAEILTQAGRRVQGTLTKVNPAYTHSFGPPIPELASIGREVRAMLREQGQES